MASPMTVATNLGSHPPTSKMRTRCSEEASVDIRGGGGCQSEEGAATKLGPEGGVGEGNEMVNTMNE